MLNERKNYYIPNNVMFKHAKYKIEDTYPLKTIRFENIKVNCVKNPIPYLDNLYWFWRHIFYTQRPHIRKFKNIKKDIFNKYIIIDNPFI